MRGSHPRSKLQQGYLTSAFSSLYAFLPLKTWATDEQMEKWKRMALQSLQEAPQGRKKQLKTQLEWLSDPSSAEGE